MINIKESNKGKFTEQANDAGMGVQEFARHVLANKDDYNSTTIKRANFARNSSKWIHKAQEGEILRFSTPFGNIPSYPVVNDIRFDRYFKTHPEVAGMAWGGGANGSDSLDKRVILVNPYTGLDSIQTKGLEQLEAVRHYQDENNITMQEPMTDEQLDIWKKRSDAYRNDSTSYKQSLQSRWMVGDGMDKSDEFGYVGIPNKKQIDEIYKNFNVEIPMFMINKKQEGGKVDSHYQYELFNRIYPDSIKSYNEYMDKIGNVDNILKNNQKKCNDYKLIRDFIEENNNIKYSDIFPYDVRNIDDDINKYTKVYGLIIPYDMSLDEFKQIINNYMSNNFPLDIKHNGGLIKKIKI